MYVVAIAADVVDVAVVAVVEDVVAVLVVAVLVVAVLVVVDEIVVEIYGAYSMADSSYENSYFFAHL